MGTDCTGGDDGGRNTNLDQAEFIDVDTVSGGSRFNITSCTVKKGVKSLQS